MRGCTSDTNCPLHLVKYPTDRQLFVLACAAAGHEAKENAKVLKTTEGNVEMILKDVRHRLGARNTKHAIALAYAHGILPIEGVDI